MARTYRSYAPEEDLLFPSSLQQWVSDAHRASYVSGRVDQLDLSAMAVGYQDEERGWTARGSRPMP